MLVKFEPLDHLLHKFNRFFHILFLHDLRKLFKNLETYLIEIAKELRFEACSRNLLVQKSNFEGFSLILICLVGVRDVYLIHQLGEQIFVKIFAKPIRKLEI